MSVCGNSQNWEDDLHRTIEGIAMVTKSGSAHLYDDTFWQSLLAACRNSLQMTNAISDASAIRHVYHKLVRWNPWYIAQLAQCDIFVTTQQLIAAKVAGALSLVFAICCDQCSSECGTWPSVEAVYNAIDGRGVVCSLCGNLNALGSSFRLPYERITCFFSPQFDSQWTSNTKRVLSSFKTRLYPAPSTQACLIRELICSPTTSTKVLLSLSSGIYVLMIPELSIGIQLTVLADPDTRERTPLSRTAFSVNSLLEKRVSGDSEGSPSSSVYLPCIQQCIEVRHGAVELEINNSLSVVVVLNILASPPDLRMAYVYSSFGSVGTTSEDRLASVASIFSRIPGGLSNASLVDQLSPPRDLTVRLPRWYVACAFSLPSFRGADWCSEWTTVEEHLGEIMSKHCGVVIETACDLSCVIAVFRSVSSALSAACCFGRRMATKLAPAIAKGCAAVIVEGEVLLRRQQQTTGPSSGLIFPRLRVCGPAIAAARTIAHSVAPALQSADRFNIALCTAQTPAANTDITVTPFTNVFAQDPLIVHLIDQIQNKYDGFSALETVTLAEKDISTSRLGIAALSLLSVGIEGCLASTECLTLEDVMDPVMLDPHEHCCSASV